MTMRKKAALRPHHRWVVRTCTVHERHSHAYTRISVLAHLFVLALLHPFTHSFPRTLIHSRTHTHTHTHSLSRMYFLSCNHVVLAHSFSPFLIQPLGLFLPVSTPATVLFCHCAFVLISCGPSCLCCIPPFLSLCVPTPMRLSAGILRQ